MKIVIFNEELRSEMQMYLALCNRHDVEIANGVEDLMKLLEGEEADLTFLDLTREQSDHDGFVIANKVRQKHPRIKVIGIIDQTDTELQQQARHRGISDVITRPIKNRELLKVIENE